MRFAPDADQRLFGETLHKVLSGTDPRARDLAAWRGLAGTGLFALAVPEDAGGAGLHPVELVLGAVELGRHAVPGPVVETLAAAALLSECEASGEWPARIASGEAVATLVLPPEVPLALDADLADLVLVADGGSLWTGGPGRTRESLDPARRLFEVTPGTRIARVSSGEASRRAYDLGALLCAGQLLGLGRALLETTVAYAGRRRQFGRPIGAFQAVKHHLADALTGLEFARPLVHGAAVTLDPADVSAAKAAASEAAYATARIALQVHGAIAYTDEYEPSLWIRRTRALRSAWGTPADHRARVLARLA